MKFFEGCTAFITGASSGLGAEFARQLAPYARTLVLVARRNDRLEELAGVLREVHPDLDVRTYVADLGVEDQRTALVKWLDDGNIAIDFLINNAGLGDHGDFAGSDWARVKAMLDVNIAALTHLTHLLVPSMIRGGRAAVLNVSSVASFFPLPNMAVYSATKAYVTSFSEAIAIELRPRGITVTALCPGPVPTEFFQVATRAGEEGSAAHFETMPAFVVSPQEVVEAGLRAVARDRARVIPGPLLAASVAVALVLPFFLVRQILRWKANSI
ncbi:MAG: SDR family oxidoreductase [Terrimicrobiaceae bacterium]|nr:SDR family oxidoreductase [Terrimicrobiaceae bacterium]